MGDGSQKVIVSSDHTVNLVMSISGWGIVQNIFNLYFNSIWKKIWNLCWQHSKMSVSEITDKGIILADLDHSEK